jgi:hypothetical protein
VYLLRLLQAAMAHGMSGEALLLRGSLARSAPVPAPPFVRQARDALLQKSPRPFVDKATAEPDQGRNVGDRDAIGAEEDNPGPSEQPVRDSGRPLPREERLALLRRESNSERGFASTSHTAPLCVRGEARPPLGGQVFAEEPAIRIRVGHRVVPYLACAWRRV